MGFVPTENAAEVELRFTLHGQQVENTLYFYNPDGVGVAGLIDLTTQLNGWYTNHLKTVQASSVVLLELYATDLTSAVAPTYSNTVLNGTPGTFTTGPCLPGNASLTVSFRTTGRGRSARGRNYFIGLPEASVVGNTVDTAYVNAIETAYFELINYLTEPWQWIVLSRVFEGADRTEGLVQPITNVIIVDPYVDSQRRRLTGRGN